jgi:hypothetical protein
MCVVPTGNVDMDTLALPPERFLICLTFPWLLLKTIVPVGVPPFWPVTVATNFTGWPFLEGFGVEVSVVVVMALVALVCWCAMAPV